MREEREEEREAESWTGHLDGAGGHRRRALCWKRHAKLAGLRALTQGLGDISSAVGLAMNMSSSNANDDGDPALPPLQPMPPPSASSSNPITPRPKAPVRYSSFVKKVGMMPSLDPEPDDTEIKFMNVDVLEEEEQVQQMRETPRQ